MVMVLVLRAIKSPFPFIFFMMLFLLLHNLYITRQLKLTDQPMRNHEDTRSKRLVQLLRKTAKADRSVIVTMVGEAWATGSGSGSILDLFLESFHIGHGTKHLLNHLLIIALDIEAFHHCNSIHPHCFYLARKPWLPLPQLKNKFFQELIELGYSFSFTDADVMWLRNPVLQINSEKDLTIACDFNSGDPTGASDKVDQGFFHMRSGAVTMEYFKYWDMSRFLYLDNQNRSLCEATASEEIFEVLGMKVEYLDVAHFGGFCQRRKNVEEMSTVRANCCESIEDKVHDLKLFLDDWRNFTAVSAEKVSSTWRAPKKCNM